ncbi:MAG: BtpA/SgcQ family protein [Planctomycetota bacterium]
MDRGELIPTLFGVPRALVGMLHVGPLAGSPLQRRTACGLDDQIAATVSEAEIYRAAGFHGLIVENMFDRPYLKGRPTLVGSGVTPANVASFAATDGLLVGSSVKQRGDWRLPLDPDAVRRIAQGLVSASFVIEDGGSRGLMRATPAEAEARLAAWFPRATAAREPVR